MNVYSIQSSIVTVLNTAFTDANLPYLAKDLPDSSADYLRGLVDPICYVFYSGSQAESTVSMGMEAQPRKIRINIEWHARQLYQLNGLYAARDVMEQILIGFRPVGCHKPLYLLRDDINQTEDGSAWVHVYQFETEAMLVQKQAGDVVLVPSFSEIINKE